MDEKRRFFRINNNGEIFARAADATLEVINISSSGVLVIKKSSQVPPVGVIELSIHNFTMDIKYQVLKTDEETMVLIFKRESEINKLFKVLKNLKYEQKKPIRE